MLNSILFPAHIYTLPYCNADDEFLTEEMRVLPDLTRPVFCY